MNTNAKKILQGAALFAFFLLIVIYAFFRSNDLIFGVQIEDVNINGLPAQTGMETTESVQKITGNAENAIFLSLNGREITIDENGNFNETIALLSGYNIINIVAKDKFGYVDEKNYKIIYKE